jgi:hypothetical protein
MAIWDGLDNIFGSGKVQGGQAGQDYMSPYTQGGAEDYANYRGEIGDLGNQLDQYGNPADWMWKSAGGSPQDFYQSMMNGYAETPQAQFEQQQMENSVNRGAAASGMAGSGAYFKALQQNSGDIIARDQDRYYGNMLKGSDQQMRYLDDYRRQQAEYRRMLGDSSRIGYGAANESGRYAGEEAQGNNDIWGGIGDALGGIAQGAALFL